MTVRPAHRLAPHDLKMTRHEVPQLHPMIARQCARRYESPSQLGIKINLYRELEVGGLAQALERDDLRGCPVECLMVGDSYFMTHLGRQTTSLATEEERAWGIRTIGSLVAEVRTALNARFGVAQRPFLIADLPDGSAETPDMMLRTAEQFIARGADVVKLEEGTFGALDCIEAAAHRQVPTILHLGYSPQTGSRSWFGGTMEEARRLYGKARQARDAGACALVLEMVSEPVNRALSAPHPGSIPIYSIFSGRAPYGGQSLNVWDAVFRSTSPRRFFPPTAALDPERDRSSYTEDLIADCLARLLKLTLAWEFPLTPPTALDVAEQQALLEVDPWHI
jgi:ketopantoate hydroxymethyltransferase